ncbi:2'-5' RNA ligase family protein [Trichormus azollae]|uniref:2'-5' RNA ligase family protein n=1 Tax=Trichormus azollae TaxID=1164 RepID=UPI00325D99CF
MTRFFIAILPPKYIQDYANEVKQYFVDKYGSRGAQNSPPHITLKPPFQMVDQNLPLLESSLKSFAENSQSVPITLINFAAFVPRVIYINVVKSQALLSLQADLMNDLENNLGFVDKFDQSRPFTPHLTVAFRDLAKQNFHAAWPEFKERQLYFKFTATYLTLLLQDGKRWNIKSEFSFSSLIQNH